MSDVSGLQFPSPPTEAAGASDDRDHVLELVKSAVAATYRRLIDNDATVHVHVDSGGGSFQLFRTMDSGEVVPITVTSPDFVRQAAAAAKLAVGSWMHDKERLRIVAEVQSQRGALVDVVAERLAGHQWWLRGNGYVAVLPQREQIPGEMLHSHSHVKVVVVDVHHGHDTAVVVSRSHPLLVHRLLEQEVPEIGQGKVVIKGLARDPGKRTKVAVHAAAAAVDPAGACIGPRGIRIRAVVAELAEEQVQIVPWSDDPATFVANALAPAVATSVHVDPDTRTATVTVAPHHLSLAIGRSGENARLVAKLTGWRIDIIADEEASPT